MNHCTKINCPLVNPSKCTMTSECPLYTNAVNEEFAETITNIIIEIIQKNKQYNTIKILQEVKDEITNNSYPIVHGINDCEMGMSLYGICQVIDEKIKTYNK